MIYYKIYLKKDPKYFFIGTTQDFKKEKEIIERYYKNKTNNLFKFIDSNGLENFEFVELFKLPNHKNNKIEKRCFLKLFNPTINK